MNYVKVFLGVGTVSALLAVAAGAFGAHLLRERLTAELLVTFETGVRYQMYHALGLIGLALALSRLGPLAVWAGWMFVAGSIIFSGSLYLLALTGIRWWGAVTPLGGICFLLGWGLFAWSAWTNGNSG